ncbi:hypothetical protein E2C01_045385 [Portunus trituberculatus]|uniref:Uncharacterized protein n=1 Tax=Portunus trituberculatus TaxID=210409 RepID=A0A5B7G1V7_PORTR|nr:hypothetical protein [Portunus trituberculatus]
MPSFTILSSNRKQDIKKLSREFECPRISSGKIYKIRRGNPECLRVTFTMESYAGYTEAGGEFQSVPPFRLQSPGSTLQPWQAYQTNT